MLQRQLSAQSPPQDIFAVEAQGWNEFMAERLSNLAIGIAENQKLIQENWTWIDLLLPGR